MLTGNKYQYIIQRDGKTKWQATAKYNPETNKFAQHANNPNAGFQNVWNVPWPDVGGGGKKPLSNNQLFCRMCAWEDENYLLAASSKGTSDKHKTNGIVDNHAYTIIDCQYDVAGTGIDLVQLRNPWGHGGEIEKGIFADNGVGWQKYPEIKRALKPIFADDGIFWMTQAEFFKHFETVWLSAKNMSQFLRD